MSERHGQGCEVRGPLGSGGLYDVRHPFGCHRPRLRRVELESDRPEARSVEVHADHGVAAAHAGKQYQQCGGQASCVDGHTLWGIHRMAVTARPSRAGAVGGETVSYTHLTLPTI